MKNTKTTAHWQNETYVVRSTGWTSKNGNDWKTSTGRDVKSAAFETATITFVGGPRNGETVL